MTLERALHVADGKPRSEVKVDMVPDGTMSCAQTGEWGSLQRRLHVDVP